MCTRGCATAALASAPRTRDAIARKQVVFSQLGTPLSSAFYLGAAHGESYGLAHTPSRYRQSWLQPATDIPALFLTGQDIVSAGVMGAAMGGLLTAIVVAPVRVLPRHLDVLARL